MAPPTAPPSPLARPSPPLTGALSQLSVPDLLQTAEAGRRSGTVVLRDGGRAGTLWLRGGRIVDAEIAGGERGAAAVYELALWEAGTFEADFTPVTVPERIFEPTAALLLEAMRRRDEALAGRTPPHAAIPDAPPPPPRTLLAVHRGLTLVNVAASYALQHLEPELLARRLEESRQALLHIHPVLTVFQVTAQGAVAATAAPVDDEEADALVRAVASWLTRLFAALERALPGRFPLRRLRAVTEAVQSDLESLGFYRELGFREPPDGATSAGDVP
jgi:hypothetical protein